VTVEQPVCPFCKSPDVTTTNKVVTASTYWRCLACGQIWNPGRLLPEWKRRPLY
jgi:transposase-like protein